MSFEVAVSSFLTVALVLMAYRCRRSFAAVFLVALAVFCVGLPLFRVAMGGVPWPATGETILFAYGGIALFAVSVFMTSIVYGDRGLARLSELLVSAHPTINEIKLSMLIIVVNWGIRIYILATTGIAFSGSEGLAIGSVSYILSSTMSITSLLGGGAIFTLTIAASRQRNYWIWLVIILEVAWTYTRFGRREVIFLLFAIIYIAWRTGSLRLLKVISSVAIVGIGLYITAPLFLVTRGLNSYYVLVAGLDSITAMGYAFSDAVSACGIGFQCSELVSENINERSNAMEFIKSVVGFQLTGYPFLYGLALLNSMHRAIPSVILAKPEMEVEQLIQANFGMPLIDDAVSIAAIAYADGGLIGCMIAGCCVAIFIRYFLWFAFKQGNELLALSMLFGLAKVLWNIEFDLVFYLVLVRDSVISMLIIHMIKFVKMLRL